MNSTRGLNSALKQSWLKASGFSTPRRSHGSYSFYRDSPGCVPHVCVTSIIKITVEPNSAAWLLLNITAPAAISSFLSPFLMHSTTGIPPYLSPCPFICPAYYANVYPALLTLFETLFFAPTSACLLLRLLFKVTHQPPSLLPQCLHVLQCWQSHQLLLKLVLCNRKMHFAGTYWTQGVDQTQHSFPSHVREAFGWSRPILSSRLKYNTAEIYTFWTAVTHPGYFGSLGMSLTITYSKHALTHTHSILFPHTDFPIYLCRAIQGNSYLLHCLHFCSGLNIL